MRPDGRNYPVGDGFPITRRALPARRADAWRAARPGRARLHPLQGEPRVKAIILSAGQGRRLLPLTERVPKCVLPVRRPLIGRQIDTLARLRRHGRHGGRGLRGRSGRSDARGALRPGPDPDPAQPVLCVLRQPGELLGGSRGDAAGFPAVERRHLVRGGGARPAAGGAGASGHACGQPQGPLRRRRHEGDSRRRPARARRKEAPRSNPSTRNRSA